MKCPECVKENKKSIIYVGSITRTMMGSRPYYDENGIYHDHDYNSSMIEHSCSNKHSWNEIYKSNWSCCERKETK